MKTAVYAELGERAERRGEHLKKFDKDRLNEVEVYLAEPDEYVREGLRAVMRDYGLRRTRAFTRMGELVTAINAAPPDLLIASGDIDATMFDTVHDIRHFRLGCNPFIMITLMVSDDGAAKRAIRAGADDVLLKPVSPGRLLDRMANMTMNRAPFIVNNDYLGPDRRNLADRPSKLKQLEVVNTLRSKIEGNRITMDALALAVESCMGEVRAARLDSHGVKLGWVCQLILKAYEEKRIDKELEEHLLILVGVLEDAATTAAGLDEPELADICTDLARRVEELAENYRKPTEAGLGTIRKLTRAFELAKAAKTGRPAAAAAERASPSPGPWA